MMMKVMKMERKEEEIVSSLTSLHSCPCFCRREDGSVVVDVPIQLITRLMTLSTIKYQALNESWAAFSSRLKKRVWCA